MRQISISAYLPIFVLTLTACGSEGSNDGHPDLDHDFSPITSVFQGEDDSAWTRSTGGRWTGPPAGWDLWANGSMTTAANVSFPAGSSLVKVRASGSRAAGTDAIMVVSVGSGSSFQTLGQVSVTSGQWREYPFTFTTAAAQSLKVRIRFTNDAVVDGEDRNLRIDWASVQTTPPGNQPDDGSNGGDDGGGDGEGPRATGGRLDPGAGWTLILHDTFNEAGRTRLTQGPYANKYRLYSGKQGGSAINNFSPDDVRVEAGKLVLTARKATTTVVHDGARVTRHYTGGGWAQECSSTAIAAEFAIKAPADRQGRLGVRGAMPYATTWSSTEKWLAEDDFFEQQAGKNWRSPGSPWQTFHHHFNLRPPAVEQVWLTVNDAHRVYHRYGVIRRNRRVTFYLDGRETGSFYRANDPQFFNDVPVHIGMGFGTWPGVDDAQYPVEVFVDEIRIWVPDANVQGDCR